MWKGCMVVVVVVAGLIACGSADKGESCDDEGIVGGDCASGLMCARSKDDETSALVCLKPCAVSTDCGANEICSGDRGRNQPVCRSK
jgi:hypothetical protein